MIGGLGHVRTRQTVEYLASESSPCGTSVRFAAGKERRRLRGCGCGCECNSGCGCRSLYGVLISHGEMINESFLLLTPPNCMRCWDICKTFFSSLCITRQSNSPFLSVGRISLVNCPFELDS